MFTGIVEERGEVASIDHLGDSVRLTVAGMSITAGLAVGESVAVNGVCLTVQAASADRFTADVMHETLAHSSLGELEPGSTVNLERAMRLDARLGGHLVQGHVDGTGALLGRRRSAHWEALRISLPEALQRYVVHKGSITVDGVSLTVAELDTVSFTVSLVPTTLRLTTLATKRVGDRVNLEVDLIAKYVEKMLGTDRAPGT